MRLQMPWSKLTFYRRRCRQRRNLVGGSISARAPVDSVHRRYLQQVSWKGVTAGKLRNREAVVEYYSRNNVSEAPGME